MQNETPEIPTAPMTTKGHTRAILTLGLPLIGGHMAQMAVGVTDTVMLGWYGVDELAAATLASTFFFVLFIFGCGFAWAVMPMIAAYLAEDDEVSIRRATRMAIWLSMAYGVLIMPVMLWSEDILLILGQSEMVAANAAEYLKVAGFGMLPALLVMVLKSYLAALERTQVLLWMTLLAACANAVANYALIFGNWGAPELGLMGAAIASVVTHVVLLAGVVLYVVLVVPQHQLFVRLWRSDPVMLKKVFTLGWPISLTVLSEVGLFAAAAVMMGWLGTVPLAAHGIVMQLASITFMLHLGLSNVATIRAGNAYGRSDLPHMTHGAKLVIAMSLAFSALTVLVFLIWPEPLIGIFMQPQETQRVEILAIGVGLLAMAALFQLVDGAQVIALGLLRGVQDTRVPMFLAGFSYWIVGVPCSYFLGFTLGFEGIGVWSGLVVGLFCACVLLNFRFWRVTMVQLAGRIA